MNGFVRSASMLLAAAAGLGLAGAAQAEYFVRPVLQYAGEMQDGLDRNGATYGEATFYDGSTSIESFVDLAAGTIKTYAYREGPSDAYTIVSGVMGEQIRYTGAEDVAVRLEFNYDAYIYADQMFTGTPEEFETRYIGIQSHFAVYEAGSGANWADWTAFGTQSDKALFVDYEITTFHEWGQYIDTFFSSGLGTDLFLTSGKSYDIFAAFNLILTPGSYDGYVTMDALNTSTISIAPPAGSSFTSQSGEFLGFAQTPAVPEPGTWAMMIGGFALVGAGMRRRKVAGKMNIAFA